MRGKTRDVVSWGFEKYREESRNVERRLHLGKKGILSFLRQLP